MKAAARHWLTALHRWAGFTLGALFVLMGLSGTVLVFDEELDAALNPALYHGGCASASTAPVDAALAADAVQARWPGARPGFVYLPEQPGGIYRVTFKAPKVADNEAMVDACGIVLGSRDRQAGTLDALHLMPTLQTWHLNMFQGKEGRMAQGYIGLAIAVLLIAGLVLAWPKSGHGIKKWRRALHVKLNQHRYRTHYDLHRAAGLLFMPLLLVLALTGFYNGLPELGRSLVAGVAPVAADRRALALPKLEKGEAAISWKEVQAIAAPYLTNGTQLVAIARQPERGLYQARMRRADDSQRSGTYRLFIDMRTGKVLQISNPRAGEYADIFLASLFPLHSGQLGGPAIKWLIALSGLLPALFFFTGITTWLLRRKKQLV
ncbi:PepSY-associated TM helix domain-containing protein [Pseudoduganella ginsengisoli]|uniref:Iron-regulated protein n=1 Tax=Pseudoduganella ginsengisoli TaxID=1462440 RepID=A0A6L6Q2Y4_9BURK|nr:PepSY-associated TM helix domain-containing protein [Pseudoduganella ginsengisoli]MTW03846.1 iron-regulated protein [Pseudoduganella ginsengisoli]